MSALQQSDPDDPVVEQLMQEFNNEQPRYELLKEARLIRAVEEATQLYERTVLGTTPAEDICVRPEDLQTAHERGLRAATNAFDNNRDPPTNFDESDQFRRSLIDNYEELSTKNKLNNEEAIEQARRLYRSDMRDWCSAEPCTSSQQIEALHGPARDKAFDKFKSKRTPYIDYSQDGYKTSFDTTINSEYAAIKRQNEANNKASIKKAVEAYEARMKAVCSPRMPCLHPDDLKAEHEEAQDLAVRVFNEGRNADLQDDDYKADLLRELIQCLEETDLLNEALNSAAVLEAYQNFASRVDYLLTYTQSKNKADFFMELTQCLEEPELMNEALNSAAVLEAYQDFVSRVGHVVTFAETKNKADFFTVIPFVGPVLSVIGTDVIIGMQKQVYVRAKDAAIDLFQGKRRRGLHQGPINTDCHRRKLIDLMKQHTILRRSHRYMDNFNWS